MGNLFARHYREIPFEELAGWADEDHVAAFSCFRVSAERMTRKPYTSKALGTDAAALARIAENAIAEANDGNTLSGLRARRFFENNFVAFQQTEAFSGFVTGYYEPEVKASRTKSDRFRFPIYKRPPDLINIDPEDPPAGLPKGYAFARQTSAGPVPYYDREAIDKGALEGLGLELFWLDDPVDVYFIHIQGSARLLLQDGSLARIAYAGKAGHPFTAVGKVMVDQGIMPLEQVTMQSIRKYLFENKFVAAALMQKNRSYIFFAEVENAKPDLGPVAAATVPLTPGRSLAVDHKLHTFGTPIFVETASPLPGSNQPFRRLMVAQDTGSAIVGPARGDLFIGSGDEAGAIAGAIKHPATFTVLRPRLAEIKVEGQGQGSGQ